MNASPAMKAKFEAAVRRNSFAQKVNYAEYDLRRAITETQHELRPMFSEAHFRQIHVLTVRAKLMEDIRKALKS